MLYGSFTVPIALISGNTLKILWAKKERLHNRHQHIYLPEYVCDRTVFNYLYGISDEAVKINTNQE